MCEFCGKVQLADLLESYLLILCVEAVSVEVTSVILHSTVPCVFTWC
jgi:hypothetical protein